MKHNKKPEAGAQMRSAFFQELKRYKIEDIANALQTTVVEAASVIRKLRSYGIVKMIKSNSSEGNKTDLSEEVFDNGDGDYRIFQKPLVFDYVGVIVVDHFIINCFPKYIFNNQSPLLAMKQVLRVLRKINSQEHIIKMVAGIDGLNYSSMLEIMLYLIYDYIEFGPYTNQREIYDYNGDGPIDWEKTINETYAIVKESKPYYLDLYTKKVVEDDNDYIRRLHLSIITECSKKLSEMNLSVLFSLSEIFLCDEKVQDFGKDDYIIFRLNQELNVQFATRKQVLLKTMIAYITQRRTMDIGWGLSVYGTNSFNLVWEKVCSDVFGNMLHVKLTQLPIPLSPDYLMYKNNTLLELIEKPIWRVATTKGNYIHEAKETFTPDIICIYSSSGHQCFGIFDAKYYSIKLNEREVEGQPGVNDIAKQYLYQLSFKSFIETHKFSKVQNAFLFPSESKEAYLAGEVELTMLSAELSYLKNIQVVMLPAQKMFEWYLTGKKINISDEFPFL